MGDEPNREELIAALRALDRREFDAVTSAARAAHTPAGRSRVAAIAILNTGGGLLTVEEGPGRTHEIGSGSAVSVPIEEPAPATRPLERGSPGDDGPSTVAAARSIVVLRISASDEEAGSASVGLAPWRQQAARLGWPSILVRGASGASPDADSAVSARQRRTKTPGRPVNRGWTTHRGDPEITVPAGDGVEIVIVGVGPDLSDLAESFEALLRAAGDAGPAS